MCLELPVELVEVRADGTARARDGARTVEVNLITLEGTAQAGDWVVAHSGFALHRISAVAARAALSIREEGT